MPLNDARKGASHVTSARFFYQNTDAPVPNRPLNLGVAALIERDGTYLMERRSDCGRWSLIGGSVRADESLREALMREVYEETGLTVEHHELFGTFSDPSRIIEYPDGNVIRSVTLVYRTRVAAGILVCSTESKLLAWVTLVDLRGLDIVETHRHIVDRLLTGSSLVLE
jgi:ADP-ribose pyrophosphatase YjhB (NUDIX family)